MKRRAKLREGRKNRLRVCRVWPHQNIDVFGRWRLRVNGNGISSDDEVFNAVLVQNGQEFFEVGVHRELRPSAHSVLG